MPAKYWTPQLDNKLALLWQNEPSADKILEQFPGKTWTALYCRASALKIRRLPEGRGLPELTLKLEPHVAAYIAAFIDGEGYVILKPAGQSARFHCKVGATNTHQGALEFIRQSVGFGDIRFIHRLGWKNVYEWEIQKVSEIWNFLHAIRPYMIIKAERADLALKWIEHRAHTAVYDKSAGRDIEQDLYERMRVLNKRGSPIASLNS